MAYNFRRGDRDQPFLLPPDLRDWLPDGHLAWFVLDVVDQLDLGPFLRGYRADGHGHPAYDPMMLLGVLLDAYAIGVRSSRQIERRCTEDLAFRVLAGNQTPDHVTNPRFRVRHQQALAGFLVESLRLSAAAGLVHLGVVALDGTKVAANAAERANPRPAPTAPPDHRATLGLHAIDDVGVVHVGRDLAGRAHGDMERHLEGVKWRAAGPHDVERVDGSERGPAGWREHEGARNHSGAVIGSSAT
jgi:transposase